MGKVSVAKKIKRVRAYVNQNGITVPQFEETNTRRPYEVVGLTCGDAILEKASGALARQKEADIATAVAPVPQTSQPETSDIITGQPSTIEDKGKKLVAELEDVMLEELKNELLQDKEFKDKMKAKLLKKLFK